MASKTRRLLLSLAAPGLFVPACGGQTTDNNPGDLNPGDVNVSADGGADGGLDPHLAIGSVGEPDDGGHQVMGSAIEPQDDGGPLGTVSVPYDAGYDGPDADARLEGSVVVPADAAPDSEPRGVIINPADAGIDVHHPIGVVAIPPDSGQDAPFTGDVATPQDGGDAG
jgi:hypothetical protein